MKRYLRVCFVILVLALLPSACATQQKQADRQRALATRDLGEAYMGQGAHTKALREFLKAESIYPDDPYLQNDLGMAYQAKGDLDLAMRHYKKALELKEDYSPARNNLGSAYIEQENWEAAIECFNEVKEDLLYGTPHYPLTNLGFVYFKLGDYDKSVAYYQEAIEIAPNFPMAHHGLGRTYMAMGNYAEAVTALKTAVEKAPNEIPIQLDLGRAYRGIHEYNKAFEIFTRAAQNAEDPKIKKEAEDEAKKAWGR
jgi:Tfp pilus assembly protein PilF